MSFIITGHPRSGTTLLQSLCDGHPDIALTNEFSCFARVGRSQLRATAGLLRHWHRVNGAWSFAAQFNAKAHNHRQNLYFTLRFLATLFKQPFGKLSAETIGTGLHQLFPQAKIVGDKWPPYMYHLPQLVTQAQIPTVIIYRDCRDVVSSFLVNVRTRWRGQDWVKNVDTAQKISRRWVDNITLMESYADTVHIIRYETLVQTPQPVLTNFAKWLDINPAGFDIDSVRSTSIGKYKNNLSAEELTTVMNIAGPTMARYGYE